MDCCDDRLYWLYDTYPDAEIVIDTTSSRAEMLNCNRCGVYPCCKEQP